jgi:hypothetical protein
MSTDLSRLKERVAMPGYNPINPIRTILNIASSNYIKGIWTGIWSFVTNPHVDYGTGGSGDPPTSIPEAIKAREGVQEILRNNQEHRRNRTTQ